jgi:hypothetical protein
VMLPLWPAALLRATLLCWVLVLGSLCAWQWGQPAAEEGQSSALNHALVHRQNQEAMGAEAINPLNALVLPAHAAKKKVTLSSMKKEVEPLTQSLQGLWMKSKSHALFGPEDMQVLQESNAKLGLWMAAFPTAKELEQPLWVAAQVLNARQQWVEALEAFSFLEAHFAASPTGKKAAFYKLQVLKQLPPEEQAALKGTF